VLTLSVVNPSANLPVDAAIDLRVASCSEASVAVLAGGEITALNSFEEPKTVAPKTRSIDAPPRTGWRHTFAPASVTVIRARLRS
jgi:alpha-L-arabinofuranosidase